MTVFKFVVLAGISLTIAASSIGCTSKSKGVIVENNHSFGLRMPVAVAYPKAKKTASRNVQQHGDKLVYKASL